MTCEDEPKLVVNSNVTSAQIERLEYALLHDPQVDCPLRHTFAPGVYLREITMPAGTFIIGHEHKTQHANVVLAGHARVLMDGIVHDIVAPCTFISHPGVRKVLYILEECRWMTVHPTHTTDLEELEAELIVKSESFMLHESEKQKLLGGAK